jgi:ATP:ADP antiporter, AAA family
MNQPAPSALQRLLRRATTVEPYEARAVLLSFLYFFFLLGSYYVIRPVRDAMGTVYGSDQLEILYTGTFVATFICAPIFGAFVSWMRLSRLLPWVYGFFAITLVLFYVLFETATQDRTLAGVFFVWVSVFNMFIISVFWSFMSDVFSRKQAKRLFGFIAAGGSLGAVAGPAVTALLVGVIGNNNLLLVSAFGFGIVILIIVMLGKEKTRLLASGEDVQRTTLDHGVGTNPFAGFTLLLKSPYLLLIAAFVLMLTWVSTILYFQQAELVSAAFESREERTRTFAVVDLVVNFAAILIQLFGTSRIVQRIGVGGGLVLVPAIMVIAFAALALSPVLMVLLVIQVVRRVAEYALARPSREMLFTIVDQESRYKAKNVIDSVVYRFGDLSQAWIQAGLGAAGFAIVGTSVVGIGVAAAWGWVARRLGKSWESAQAEAAAPAASAARTG